MQEIEYREQKFRNDDNSNFIQTCKIHDKLDDRIYDLIKKYNSYFNLSENMRDYINKCTKKFFLQIEYNKYKPPLFKVVLAVIMIELKRKGRKLTSLEKRFNQTNRISQSGNDYVISEIFKDYCSEKYRPYKSLRKMMQRYMLYLRKMELRYE